MSSTTASTPSPVWQLVSSTGRPARTSFASSHHALQIDSHVRREIDLVDRPAGRTGARPAPLARNVVAAGDVDHEQPIVDQVERKSRGEIVAAAFDQDQIECPETGLQLVGGLDVQRRILTDRGVRARAGLHCHARAPGRSGRCACTRSASSLVTRSLVITARIGAARDEARDELLQQRGLARADRPADADARGAGVAGAKWGSDV